MPIFPDTPEAREYRRQVHEAAIKSMGEYHDHKMQTDPAYRARWESYAKQWDELFSRKENA